jgi:adenylyltransferase/sulfurtransferase
MAFTGEFTQEQMERYSRHILIPEIGGSGQRRLLGASVLVVGAGGLGAPSLLYLAAAGVGKIGIIDDDSVERTNLQRQIIHGTSDLGRPKVDSARETIADLNPDVEVVTHSERLSKSNILGLLEGYEAVVDGSDNFPTRYLVNDACFFAKTPLFMGAVFRFEGQATVFRFRGDGPCYRCLFPQAPPPGLIPSCQEAGILGVVAGLIGLIQATEAVKHFAEVGESLEGTLLLLDALSMQFRRVTLRRDPKCPLCGEKPSITELVESDPSCEFQRR